MTPGGGEVNVRINDTVSVAETVEAERHLQYHNFLSEKYLKTESVSKQDFLREAKSAYKQKKEEPGGPGTPGREGV